MASTTRAWGVTGVLMAAILAAHEAAARPASGPAHADGPVAPEAPRVRTNDPALAALIQEATDRSPTFRHLAERIQASDGMAYIVRGRCGHNVRACLALWVGVAPPNRLLRVVVDPHEGYEEVMASIAHELRHVLEVLDEPGVRSRADMFFFYTRDRPWQGQAFETQAAVEAGHVVFRELKENRAKSK